jgi:hypothetical protein
MRAETTWTRTKRNRQKVRRDEEDEDYLININYVYH